MADAGQGSDPIVTPEARLELARSLEERQQRDDALLAYYRAIIESQRQGLWLSKATTPPALVERVAHAMRYVKAGRRRIFGEALEPVVARHGRGALTRFEECLAIQVGERNPQSPDPRQRPSILYFPGLPATPYFKRSEFPWTRTSSARRALSVRNFRPQCNMRSGTSGSSRTTWPKAVG